MVSSVALIAVAAAVIGAVTTIALRSYLYDQLDGQLREVARRAAGPPGGRGLPSGNSDGPFVAGGGQPVGTVGAVVTGGEVTDAVVSEQRGADSEREPRVVAEDLTSAQASALGRVPADGGAHSVDLPGLGEYRTQSVKTDGGTYLVGIPTEAAEATIRTLILVEVCVAGAGLVAAGIAGTVLVGVALRPLRRMVQTASRVSELPLARGEVRLRERVPEGDTDPGTEVGQVGAALNRMLGHVGSALVARQESEMRVRRFVADASHELRTPLASIRGYAELTRRGGERVGPDTGHALSRIEAESARMSGLVEDLLLLARLDAGVGGRGVSCEVVDVSRGVVDAVSDARVAGGGHVWRLDVPPEPVWVVGEAGRLQQVWVNLLANARTHTPVGTVVWARVRRVGGEVVVEVEDGGPGIAVEVLPRVFERFARGDVSRSRAHGSTGLGLAIVRAVVGAHGGRVEVESVPGRTVFRVLLPAAPHS
ncbi:HAMP domain-containing sensor histidine kinase [Streptomyces daliensis]